MSIAVFALVAAAGAAWILFIARNAWFSGDEWALLTRNNWSLHELFRPNTENWETVPTVIYRVLWSTVGIRTYVPYLLIAVATHVSTVCLLLVIMRRGRVDRWLAVVCAVFLLVFGGGSEVIVQGIGSTWSLALAFALAQLVLADHDGELNRRDVFGLIAGLLALMSAIVALPIVIAVAISTLLRRGWRIALLHTVPLLFVYIAWYAAFGRTASEYAHLSSPDQMAKLVARYLRLTFDAVGRVPLTGIALVALAVLALFYAARNHAELRTSAAPAIGLFSGGLIFLIIAGIGRAGAVPAVQSRYVYVTTASMLPGFAYAVTLLSRRWRPAIGLAIVLLAVNVPANARTLADSPGDQRPFATYVLTLPRLPAAACVPSSMLLGALTPGVTIGWLRAGVRSGRVPPPARVPPEVWERWDAALGEHCPPDKSSPQQPRRDRPDT